jgi:hypothetical protein
MRKYPVELQSYGVLNFSVMVCLAKFTICRIISQIVVWPVSPVFPCQTGPLVCHCHLPLTWSGFKGQVNAQTVHITDLICTGPALLERLQGETFDYLPHAAHSPDRAHSGEQVESEVG